MAKLITTFPASEAMPKPANVEAHIRALHAAYEARTGFKIILNYQRLQMWHEWCKHADWTWGETELARVIAYLRNKIQTRDRNEGALKFFNLIGHPDTFEEDLALAKESARCGPTQNPRPKRQEPAAPAPQDLATTEDFNQLFKRP